MDREYGDEDPRTIARNQMRSRGFGSKADKRQVDRDRKRYSVVVVTSTSKSFSIGCQIADSPPLGGTDRFGDAHAPQWGFVIKRAIRTAFGPSLRVGIFAIIVVEFL